MITPKFKKIKWQPGMVYVVPLIDGSFGYAQAIDLAMVNVVDLVLFSVRDLGPPEVIPNLGVHDVISYSATWRQSLNGGVWKSLGVFDLIVSKMDHPNQKLIAANAIGIKHSDIGLLSDLLNAWHGLIPWNVMFDEEYYDKKLAKGVSRPKSAVILSPDDRLKYREDNP